MSQMAEKSPLLESCQAYTYPHITNTPWTLQWVGRVAGNERVASIFHTLAARQEPHYLGFQPLRRPCYPQVLSIVSCRIIRPQPQLFIEDPTEFHDSETACTRVRTSECTAIVVALILMHHLRIGSNDGNSMSLAERTKLIINGMSSAPCV